MRYVAALYVRISRSHVDRSLANVSEFVHLGAELVAAPRDGDDSAGRTTSPLGELEPNDTTQPQPMSVEVG